MNRTHPAIEDLAADKREVRLKFDEFVYLVNLEKARLVPSTLVVFDGSNNAHWDVQLAHGSGDPLESSVSLTVNLTTTPVIGFALFSHDLCQAQARCCAMVAIGFIEVVSLLSTKRNTSHITINLLKVAKDADDALITGGPREDNKTVSSSGGDEQNVFAKVSFTHTMEKKPVDNAQRRTLQLERFTDAQRLATDIGRGVMEILHSHKHAAARDKEQGPFFRNGFGLDSMKENRIMVPRWVFYSDATDALISPAKLQELLECAKWRLQFYPDQCKTDVELACEMISLPALCCVYRLDHVDNPTGTRVNVDQWLSPLSHPVVRDAGIDCEDCTELAWHIVSSLRNSDPATLGPELQRIRDVVVNQYEVFIAIGTLDTSDKIVYHAYILGVDKRWMSACINNARLDVEWPMQLKKPFLIELTNYSTSDCSIDDEVLSRRHDNSWNPDSEIDTVLLRKIPLHKLKRTNQYHDLLLGITPHWVKHGFVNESGDAVEQTKGVGEIFFLANAPFGSGPLSNVAANADANANGNANEIYLGAPVKQCVIDHTQMCRVVLTRSLSSGEQSLLVDVAYKPYRPPLRVWPSYATKSLVSPATASKVKQVYYVKHIDNNHSKAFAKCVKWCTEKNKANPAFRATAQLLEFNDIGVYAICLSYSEKDQ